MSTYITTYDDEQLVMISDGRARLYFTAEEALELTAKLAQTAIQLARHIVADEQDTARLVREETKALATKHGTTVEAIKAAADNDEEEA